MSLSEEHQTLKSISNDDEWGSVSKCRGHEYVERGCEWVGENVWVCWKYMCDRKIHIWILRWRVHKIIGDDIRRRYSQKLPIIIMSFCSGGCYLLSFCLFQEDLLVTCPSSVQHRGSAEGRCLSQKHTAPNDHLYWSTSVRDNSTARTFQS